jgi:hypothetical protein
MRFWRTDSLVDDIRNGSLTQVDEKNYYISLALVGILSAFSGGTESNLGFDLIWVSRWALLAVVTIIGFNIAFRVNGGASGQRFLSKLVPLAFPISLKLFLLSFAFGFFSVMIGVTANLPLPTDNRYFMIAFSLFIEFLFFWRICVHLKRCNEET